MLENASIWQLAGLTAALGMGVVFVSLFLLSVYMHYFKLLTARIEGKGQKDTGLSRPKAPARPVVAPAPRPSVSEEDGQLAASVAVGLYLDGVRSAPAGDVAAAIATALALHRVRTVPRRAAAAVSNWRLAGRMEAMASRLKRHDRPLRQR